MDTQYLRTIFGRFVQEPWPEKRLALRNRFKQVFNYFACPPERDALLHRRA